MSASGFGIDCGQLKTWIAAAWLAGMFQLPATFQAAEKTPFRSEAIRCGNTLFVSGQGSRQPDSGLAAPNYAEATRNAMSNVGRVLAEQDYDFSDVVAANVWLADLGKYSEMNEVYRTFFNNAYPTRTTLGVSALPGGSKVQVAVVAVKGPKHIVYPEGSQPSNLPFSPGILTGKTLYLSGSVGLDPATGRLVEGEIADHVEQTFKNLNGVLKAVDMNFENVVSAYFFFQNVRDFGGINETWQAFTSQPRPCRLPVGVAAIPLNSPVEITMIASRDSPFWAARPPATTTAAAFVWGVCSTSPESSSARARWRIRSKQFSTGTVKCSEPPV